MPINPNQVNLYTISKNELGQRIDNFLLRVLKKVPKSKIYRIIRKGEVRVNKKRIKPEYKLQIGDVVRIPPIKIEETKESVDIPPKWIDSVKKSIIVEDDNLIAINKPSGLGVHSGSHASYGLIEIIRHIRSDDNYLELVHRLDLETSGVVLIAKSRVVLQELHELLRDGHKIEKYYTTLVKGRWKRGKQRLSHKLERQNNQAKKVNVSEEGKASTSIFEPKKYLKGSTLMEVQILTGRTHQIRTQLAHLKHPIIGDRMYGDKYTNEKFAQKYGLKRLFLHASRMVFILKGKKYEVGAALPQELYRILKNFN
ncbi:MAG: RluA family pseudouridine synthase [Campylobacterota bacterium]|nr:RluA family pseudouridine synthase [Campylobacterota bacterium]